MLRTPVDAVSSVGCNITALDRGDFFLGMGQGGMQRGLPDLEPGKRAM